MRMTSVFSMCWLENELVIVVSDNDVILKLAQCNLLSQLPAIFNQQPDQVFINPSARFQLLHRNPDKAIAKCGSQAIYEKVGEFLGAVRDIGEVQDDDLLNTLAGIPYIDAGEQQLLAACMENAGSIFMTGDRRCLTAVMENQEKIPQLHGRLIDSVVTFESALLLSVECLGFQAVHDELIFNPKPDSMLQMALRGAGAESVCGCFFSFTRSLYDYLAYKDRLPARNWQL